MRNTDFAEAEAPKSGAISIDAARSRYQRFQRDHRSTFGHVFRGKLLDFGCGAGSFLIAALKDGQNVYGVEVDPARHDQFMANAERNEPAAKDRIALYSGRVLPYASNYFDGVFSWFVFEHVTDPQVSLREIARVLKPGGTLTLLADDVRNGWDGHIKAPWPPYMPRELARAYLSGLGMSEHADFVTNAVVYISAPVIADILETVGMEVVYASEPSLTPVVSGLDVVSEAQAFKLGREVAKMRPFKSPPENLRIFARKQGATVSQHEA